jgi:hypothetical protein
MRDCRQIGVIARRRMAWRSNCRSPTDGLGPAAASISGRLRGVLHVAVDHQVINRWQPLTCARHRPLALAPPVKERTVAPSARAAAAVASDDPSSTTNSRHLTLQSSDRRAVVASRRTGPSPHVHDWVSLSMAGSTDAITSVTTLTADTTPIDPTADMRSHQSAPRA